MRVDIFHNELLRAGRELHADEIVKGFSYWIFNSRGVKKRVIRLADTAHGLELKRAATFRATKSPDAEGPFDGTLSELLDIVDSEVALIRAGVLPTASKTRLAEGDPPAAKPLQSGERGAEARLTAGFEKTTPSNQAFIPLDPEVIQNGVDVLKAVIYRWQVFDTNEALIGVYIGLARAMRGRARFNRYRNHVRRIQLGLPYATNPDEDYRKVHYALANAVKAGARIVFTYLRNGGPDESLEMLESRLIVEHGSFGLAAHQLHETRRVQSQIVRKEERLDTRRSGLKLVTGWRQMWQFSVESNV